jgi:hypothetical protein
MAGIANPANTYTLEDFVATGQSDQLTYSRFSIIEEINGVKFASYNILSDYIKELKQICIKIPKKNITQAQLARYKYNPDLLAYDIYGSTELDFVIMQMNGIIDPKDFDLPTLKLVYKSDLANIMNRIYSAESVYLTANRDLNNLIMPV